MKNKLKRHNALAPIDYKYVYHSSHGSITNSNFIVNEKLKNPVPNIILNSKYIKNFKLIQNNYQYVIGKKVNITIKNKASVLHSIQPGDITIYGYVDTYFDETMFEDYCIFEGIVDLFAGDLVIKINSVKLYNKKENLYKNFYIKDKFSFSVPGITFDYLDDDDNFNVGSFLLEERKKRLKTIYSTKNKSIWSIKNAILKTNLDNEPLVSRYNNNSYLSFILSSLFTFDMSTLDITIFNSSCMSSSEIHTILDIFMEWSIFYKNDLFYGTLNELVFLQKKFKIIDPTSDVANKISLEYFNLRKSIDMLKDKFNINININQWIENKL